MFSTAFAYTQSKGVKFLMIISVPLQPHLVAVPVDLGQQLAHLGVCPSKSLAGALALLMEMI